MILSHTLRLGFLLASLGANAVPVEDRRGESASTRGRPPNIVVLLADDMGFGDPRCFNPESRAPTPNLDRLARQGRRFTDAHSPASVCSPTRYALLTGRYAWRGRLKLGVLNPRDPPLIEKGRLTLPAMLKSGGYSTFGIGKWHLGWEWSTTEGKTPLPDQNGREFTRTIDFLRPISEGPTTRGFDHYFGMVGNTVSSPCLILDDRPIVTGNVGALRRAPEIAGVSRTLLDSWDERNSFPVLTEKAVATIEQLGSALPRRPFFLYFAMTAPHSPMTPWGKFRGRTGAGDSCDFVNQLDDSVGRVLDALDRHRLADDTLVILSSDNGSPGFANEGAPTGSVIPVYGHRPNGRFRGMKGDAHEGGHRVPFIARWPGHIPAGTTCEETICLVDLMATCSSLIGRGLPADAAEDSHDILTALLDTPHPRPIREATIHHALIGMFAIRQGDWKLILGRGSGGFTLPQWVPPKAGEPEGQLYNLVNDPGETRDLYTQHPEIVGRLTKLLQSYKDRAGSAPRLATPNPRVSIEKGRNP